MMWNAVSQIGSGFALVAFLAAIAVTAYRAKLSNDVQKLKQLPAQERADALGRVLDSFDVDTAGLTKEQRYELALRQIAIRQYKLFVTAIVSVILAIILSVSVLVYVLYGRASPPVNQPNIVKSAIDPNDPAAAIKIALSELTVMDVVVGSDAAWILANQVVPGEVLRDPGGAEYPLKQAYVIRIGYNLRLTKVSFARLPIGMGTINYVNGTVTAFLNYKDEHASFSLNGEIYKFDTEGDNTSADTLFEGQNWGWFPMIIGENIKHYSFDGSKWITNTTPGDSVPRRTAEAEFKSYEGSKSDGIFPPAPTQNIADELVDDLRRKVPGLKR